jgi:hypothetical protein
MPFAACLSALFFSSPAYSQHNPGRDCISCYQSFRIGGTVFSDSLGVRLAKGASVSLVRADGSTITLDKSNAELGNPYYESIGPMGVQDPSVTEDYNSISRGFNLHEPYPNPFNGAVGISFNVFDRGQVNISICSSIGQKIATLMDQHIENLGVHKLEWKPGEIATGVYYVVMTHGSSVQERRVLYLK